VRQGTFPRRNGRAVGRSRCQGRPQLLSSARRVVRALTTVASFLALGHLLSLVATDNRYLPMRQVVRVSAADIVSPDVDEVPAELASLRQHSRRPTMIYALFPPRAERPLLTRALPSLGSHVNISLQCIHRYLK